MTLWSKDEQWRKHTQISENKHKYITYIRYKSTATVFRPIAKQRSELLECYIKHDMYGWECVMRCKYS